MSDTTGLIRQTDAGHEEGLEAGERCQLALSRRPCCSHCTIPESTDVCLRVVFGGGGGGVLLGSGGGRCLWWGGGGGGTGEPIKSWFSISFP